MIMYCIRHPRAKCLFPNPYDLQVCAYRWGERTDSPGESLLDKQPLGSAVHFSPLPWEQGGWCSQEWEKSTKGKPRKASAQDWGGRDPNTSITLLPETSGHTGGSLQHPQPLCLGRAETVHDRTQRDFRRVSVTPEKNRTDIHKFSCIKNLSILSLTSVNRSGI